MSNYKILLIVDVQKEFADIENHSQNYHKIIQYIKKHANIGFYDKIISTGFRNNINNNFRYNLNWYECENSNEESLEYLKYIEKSLHTIIFKTGYGDISNSVINAIRNYDDTITEDAEIHIIGCDLDACVMAICFQLWDAGITNFKVLTEYCYTTAKDFSKEDIIKIMKRNFGKCIVKE